MGGRELDVTQQPLRRAPNPWILDDLFSPEDELAGDGPVLPPNPIEAPPPVQDVAAQGDPANELCGQDERAAERVRVEGDTQARAMLAHLTPEEMGRALAYHISRYAHNDSTLPASELSMTQRAQAFIEGVNSRMQAAGSNIRFAYVAGPPPRLEQRAGSAEPVTIQIPASLLTEGNDVVQRIVGRTGVTALLQSWHSHLQTATPPITNEALRRQTIERFQSVFPQLDGEGPAQRAARIRALLPLINQHFHARNLHVEIDNDCRVNLYAWTPGAPLPGRRGDAITAPMELMPADARTVQIRDAVTAILNPTAPDAIRFPGREAIIAGLDGPAQQRLARLIYSHYRTIGQPLLAPLNEALHAEPHRLHIEIPAPSTRGGRTELDIYEWNPGPPAVRGRLIIGGIRMDQQTDIAQQFEPQRQGMDAARLIGIVLARYASHNEAPDEDTRADVADYFWRRMRRAETTMNGRNLNERRMDYVQQLQASLRTQGLDIEFDPARPDTVRIFRFVDGRRVGDGIEIPRPNYFAAPTQEVPGPVTDQEIDRQIRESRNRGLWEGMTIVLGAMLVRYLYRRWRGIPDNTTRPPGTTVDVPRETYQNLQRPFEDIARRLAERGGPASGFERGRFDPRVLALIDSAIADAQAGRVVWTQAEIEAMQRFRTTYDGLRTATGPIPLEAQALHMMLDGTRPTSTGEVRPDTSARSPVRLTGDSPAARATDLARLFEAARTLNPSDPFFNAENIRSFRARCLALMDQLSATETAGRPEVLREFTRAVAADLFPGGTELLQRVNIVANPHMDAGSTLGLHTFRDGSGRAFTPAFRDGAHFVENYTDAEGRPQQRRIPVSEVSVDIEVPASRLGAGATNAQLHETLASIYDQMFRINRLANMTAAEATHQGTHDQISSHGNRLADFVQHNINADSVVSDSARDARALLHSSQPISLTRQLTMEMTARGMVFRDAEGREMTEEMARRHLEEELPRETARIRRVIEELQRQIDAETNETRRNQLIERRNNIQRELTRLETLHTELRSTDASVRDPARSRLFDAARRAYESGRARFGGRLVPFAFIASEAIRLLAR